MPTTTRTLVAEIMRDLQRLGIGTDEPISGADAVDYLNRLYETLEEFQRQQRRPVNIALRNVDWTLLRRQKIALLRAINTSFHPGHAANLKGLVHLLDNIQDQAAEQIGTQRVFGTKS